MRQRMIAKIERASPVRQPAHDELVAPDLLLSVDAQILASGVVPAGNDQAPRQQRGPIAGPAALQWNLVQVHVVAFPDNLLARRAFDWFGVHVTESGLEHGNFCIGVAKYPLRSRHPPGRPPPTLINP